MIKYFTIEDLLKHYLQKKFHILNFGGNIIFDISATSFYILFALFIPSTQLHKITILSKFTLIYVRHPFVRQVQCFLLNLSTQNRASLLWQQENCLRAG